MSDASWGLQYICTILLQIDSACAFINWATQHEGSEPQGHEAKILNMQLCSGRTSLEPPCTLQFTFMFHLPKNVPHQCLSCIAYRCIGAAMACHLQAGS